MDPVNDLGCQDVEEHDLVSAYLGERLSEPEAEAFERHYFGCERCWAEVKAGEVLFRVEDFAAEDVLGDRFRANPRDPDIAIRYAHALRATGQRAQAAAVLETAALHNPENRALLGAYGRALADVGNFKQAMEVLERAHSPDRPDWPRSIPVP